MPNHDEDKSRYQSIPIRFEQSYVLDGKEVREIMMRPPTADDRINAQIEAKNAESADKLFFANLTNTTEEFLGELAFFDYKKVEAANNCFLVPLSIHFEQRALYLAAAAESE